MEGLPKFTDPQVLTCPFPHYDRLRREAPVYLDPSTGVYVVTRYQDVLDILKDPVTFSNKTGLVQTRGSAEVHRFYEANGVRQVSTLIDNDPPDHRAYRALLEKTFTAKRVKELEPYLRQNIAAQIEEAIAHGGEIDIIPEFAIRLPLVVISDLAGAPR